MAVYLTPGIYRRARQSERRDMQLVRTDVAGFAGFTERGPLATEVEDPRTAAVRLTSWKEFVAMFGGFIRHGYLAYAVRAFFENGGRTCHVVRVAASAEKEPLGAPRRAAFAVPWRERTVAALVLTAPAQVGETRLRVKNAQKVAQGDLLRIRDEAAEQFVMVAESEIQTLHLAEPLRHEYKQNSSLSVFDPALRITARSSGHWANRLRITITPFGSGPGVREFALRIRLERPRGVKAGPLEEEFFNRLSLDETSPFFAPTHVNAVSNLVCIGSGKPADEPPKLSHEPPSLLFVDSSFPTTAFSLQGGQDGLQGLTTRDFTGGLDDLRGIRLLEEIDEVAILCAPDAVLEPVQRLERPPAPAAHPCVPNGKEPPGDEMEEDATAEPPALEAAAIYQAMLDQCERRRDRVAILDAPAHRRTAEQLKDWRDRFVTRFGALYCPWLVVPDEAEIEGPIRRIPPSGHVAGIYARLDNTFGVHRPPANAPLDFVDDVADEISELGQQNLNPYGINAIRSFHGRGIRLWGARSLAGSSDADWRFIHTRRLMSMIEESVDKSTQWAVFEPNNEALRRTLVHSLSVFLEAIWRQGGLKGDRPAQGFYVKCDETNNPRAIIDAGRIVCEVGVAIAAPMEFIVFEIRQMPGAAELVER